MRDETGWLELLWQLVVNILIGSISARVLSNQSVRACDLGSFLLLGVSGTMVK